MNNVAILLCTFNGARYLRPQLDSVRVPTGYHGHLHVSDDGSTDGTLDIVSRTGSESAFQSVSIHAGPRRGFCANFLSLICNDKVNGQYFAYCDQDDIWDEDKLFRALDALEACPQDVPALYCARTRSLSASGELEGNSPLFRKEPSFRNALVHNIGGGNTMVMNRAARDLLRAAGVVDVPSHDWWTYLLISGAGGRVIYDPEPCLSYRQHVGNLIGSNLGFRSMLKRYRATLLGRNRAWADSNLDALKKSRNLLSTENRAIVDVMVQSRDGGTVERLKGLGTAGLYAQTNTGNIGLWLATLLKKI